MLRSSPFHPNMNLRYKTWAFSHIAMGASSAQSVNILETFLQYVSIYNLDFCSYNFHISWFSRSGTCEREFDVYRFMSKHVDQTAVCFCCHDHWSHIAIDVSSWIKCKWITAKNMSLSTECTAALLSFRYPSYTNKSEQNKTTNHSHWNPREKASSSCSWRNALW